MANDKMKILKMLEEGKINAEDAAKLLAGGEQATTARETGAKPGAGYGYPANNQQTPLRPEKGPSSFDSFAGDLGRRFEGFMKDIEPKIQKFAEKAAEKTSEVADSISKSFSGAPKSGPHYGNPARDFRSRDASLEKNLEIPVKSGGCELSVSGLNGPALLRGYNGDRITAKISYKPRRGDAALEFITLGNKYILKYDADLFEKVAIDAYIPYNMFSAVSVRSENGAAAVSGIDCETLSVAAVNGSVEISRVNTGGLRIESQNAAEIKLSGIAGRAADIDSTNGEITIADVDVENLKVSAMNAPVSLNIPGFRRFSDYTWLIETSNRKLSALLPSSPETGYYLKASASLGSVRVGLTGLNYLYGDSHNAEAKSFNFDSADKRVRISLETSNAGLTVD